MLNDSGNVIDWLDILRDPSDPSQTLSQVGSGLVASGSNRSFQIVDGIPDLLCPDLEPPSHYPVGDAEWAKWVELQATVFSEFTYSTGAAGYIQELGHREAVKYAPQGGMPWILEIGSGASHHLLTHGKNYPASARYINADANRSSLARARALWQQKHQANQSAFFVRASSYHLPFASHSINYALAIYVFEHLKHLDLAIQEFLRVVAQGGAWCMVLPTEGGLAWKLGRKLMYSRQIRQRYGINYDRMMAIEHCNTSDQVIAAVRRLTSCQVRYAPLGLPTPHINAVVVLSGRG